jgi:hypothetical protein
MSAMLLLEPDLTPYPPGPGHKLHQHEYADDLESFFHILLCETMLHLDLDGFDRGAKLVKKIRDLFDAAEPDPMAYRLNGGNAKLTFITIRLPSIKPSKTKPLQDLIENLCKYFDSRYHTDSYEPGNEHSLGKYKNPDAVLELFEKSLARDDWPMEDDKHPEDLFQQLRISRYGS